MRGTIIKGIGGFYYVKTDDGGVYECRARGKFRKDRVVPMIGDDVEFDKDGTKGSITRIYERRSFLTRPAVANIDALIIVAAAASPEPNAFLTDKLAVNAEANGIEPVICVNKTDLADGSEFEKIYRSAGYKTCRVSALSGEGIDALTDILRGRITAFAGLSGVGKSSLLNRITGVNAETGSVSERLRRGRHTTRHVELFALPYGGFILDTPGFGSFDIEGVSAADLWTYFPEMRGAGMNCRFRGCSHISEPDCAVRAMAESGKIAPSRYESYKEIYKVLKEIKVWEKE